jgi:hypothetical protein
MWSAQVDIPTSVQITAPLGVAPASDGTDDGMGNHIFLNSDQYLASVMFAGGQQLYAPSVIPFSYHGSEGNWSITPFEIHPQSGLKNSSINATVTVETYGINTQANCLEATSIEFGDDGLVNATLNGCSFTFFAVLDTNYTRWHFASSVPCNNATSDIAFNTFISALYGTAGYNSSDPSQFLVLFCQPTILIAKVRATLSVSQGVIGALTMPPIVLETFSRGIKTSDPQAAALLGPPLNGFAINGYNIAEPDTDPLASRLARANLTQEILFEGIYGAQLSILDTENSSCEHLLPFHSAGDIITIPSTFFHSFTPLTKSAQLPRQNDRMSRVLPPISIKRTLTRFRQESTTTLQPTRPTSFLVASRCS